ncbi:MAG: lysylphosphatidylglycerol synthase transmembrane domain-containing protein [Mariprofundaceae bacterium]|nr:lysylphosphatidylglycerol synthase transmembrane domain-containing protein [Mariprofundaceae bacterium]
MSHPHFILALKIIFTFGLLYAVLMYVDLNQVWQRIAMVNPLWLVAAWLCLVAGYVLCGLRWAWIAQGLGIEVSRKRKIRLYFLGMFASLFLPSTIGGDVVRGILLAKGDGRSNIGLRAAASVILDRVNGMYALIALLTVSMLMFSWPTAWWWSWLTMVAAMWFVMLLYPWLHTHLPEKLAVLKKIPLHRPEFQQMWWRSLPVSLSFQVMIVQAHVFLGIAVGLDMNWAAFSIMVGLVALVATLPISLNGFGVREAGYVGFAVYFGASADAATAMAALWIIILAIAALPGAWVLWRLGGIKSLRSNEKNVQD